MNQRKVTGGLSDVATARCVEGGTVKMTDGMFSSIHPDWRTPRGIYEKLDAEFHFDFDPCPPNPTFDGLKIPWGKSNFVNPPYGREIIKWCEKALGEHLNGKTVVMLVASRTDTQWWHDYIMKADEIRFIKGRLKFEGHPAGGSAPFPSAVVIFRPREVE